MAGMMSLTAASRVSGLSLLANYGSRKLSGGRCFGHLQGDRLFKTGRPVTQGLGMRRNRFWNSDLIFGKASRRFSFSSVIAGAEKVGFAGSGDGGGDLGGGTGGRGGGGGSGDDLSGRSGDDSSQGFGSTIWIWYNSMLENHPLIAKSLTSALLNALADYFCQVFVEKLPRVDWKRFWSFVAIGLFLSGPGLHYWYGALPRIITVPGLGGVLLRIGLDQIVFTPLGMLSFFVVLLTLENRQNEIQRKLEKDWWPTVLANWKVWVPFQVVNFSLVPPQLQVPAAGLLGMVWSVFISYKGHT